MVLGYYCYECKQREGLSTAPGVWGAGCGVLCLGKMSPTLQVTHTHILVTFTCGGSMECENDTDLEILPYGIINSLDDVYIDYVKHL